MIPPISLGLVPLALLVVGAEHGVFDYLQVIKQFVGGEVGEFRPLLAPKTEAAAEYTHASGIVESDPAAEPDAPLRCAFHVRRDRRLCVGQQRRRGTCVALPTARLSAILDSDVGISGVDIP